MRKPALSQKQRFVLLLIEVAILCLANKLAFGTVLPSGDNKGFWFYTALLGLVLGSRLDTPFFAKPADVVLYAAPAAIALALVNSWTQWDEGVRVAYCLAMAFCIAAGLLGAFAILTVGGKNEGLQKFSNAARVLAETLGAPRTIFTIVMGFALFAFHRESSKEIGVITAVWILTGVLSPLEGVYNLGKRIMRIFGSNTMLEADGEVVAYQTPGLILIRQFGSGKIESGEIVAVHDPLGKMRLALALDHVGRDEGVLLRTIEITDAKVSEELRGQLASLQPNAVARVSVDEAKISKSRLIKTKGDVVGLVAADTSVERLFFEVVNNEDLEEGRLVEVQIGSHYVTYQLVNGLTKEEIVQQKNTHGFARAQGQKIGEWDAEAKRFKFVKWLPAPNAPVFLKTTKDFEQSSSAIGHFPGTDYPVSIKSIDELVTHNTAILGILGVGKSMLAIELVERMIASGIKAICIDLTNQYVSELAPYIAPSMDSTSNAELQQIGLAGKTRVAQNVEEGGSRRQFATAVTAMIREFVNPSNSGRLLIFNPSQFEVWRQDSKPFSGVASMATLSPAEITHIISHATLEATSALGMTDKARVCLVYEEAHSLVPEWNSAVAEGDRAASNGSARAILQGRKYGLGCLLITQRTANVTKTILNQCNTIFAMRTFDDTGKDFLANFIGKEYAASLPSLSERQAVLFGKASSCENPILIRLNDRENFLPVFRAENPPPALPGPDTPNSNGEAALTETTDPSTAEPEDDIPF
jgi:hypothetical protein